MLDNSVILARLARLDEYVYRLKRFEYIGKRGWLTLEIYWYMIMRK